MDTKTGVKMIAFLSQILLRWLLQHARFVNVPYALILHPSVITPPLLRSFPDHAIVRLSIPLSHRASNCTILPPISPRSRSRKTRRANIPLGSLLVQHTVSAFLAPDWVSSLQRNLGVAVAAQVIDGWAVAHAGADAKGTRTGRIDGAAGVDVGNFVGLARHACF